MKLSSEDRLLIGCLARADSEPVSQLTALITERSISWDRVMQLAHWHRMTGSLYAFLRDNFPQSMLPKDDVEHLRGHYAYTAVRGMYIRSEFSKAVKALQSERIEVMALKGVTLLGSVYRDAGTRDMSDIDLLVRSDSADRAQEIVQGLGYEPVGTEAVQEHTRQNHRHLPKLHKHERELSFEVHTHVVSYQSPLQFDIETVWKHARPAELHGVEVLVPAPEHMLLHLALHFFLDRRFTSGSSLRQLGDIAGLIALEGDEFNWDFFVDEVRRCGLEGPVYTVLSTASTLVGADVPPAVLRGLEPVGYSAQMEELFVRQRVLQANTLTATELVPHQSDYTLGAVLKAVLRRVMPNRRYLETHYGEQAIDASGRTRLKRLGEAAGRTFSYLRNPLRLWQEVKVDRWLHSLSSGGVPVTEKSESAQLLSEGNK